MTKSEAFITSVLNVAREKINKKTWLYMTLESFGHIGPDEIDQRLIGKAADFDEVRIWNKFDGFVLPALDEKHEKNHPHDNFVGRCSREKEKKPWWSHIQATTFY